VTIIQGAGATNGPNAVRCAWLTNGAALLGFTLTGGATTLSGTSTTLAGGGVWCAGLNSIVANCVIVSNTADLYGGGAYQGTLQNCLVSGNTVANLNGGGAAYSVMISCTVVYNSGYGVYATTNTNCIVYYNSYTSNPNGTVMAYCCTPQPPVGGPGNISTAPQLFADNAHLLAGSPCIGKGTNLVTGPDIFGHAWNNPPSIGCAEWTPAPVVTPAQIQFTGNPAGITVSNTAVAGTPPLAYSWLQNGAPLANNSQVNGAQTPTLSITGLNFVNAGGYQLVVSNAYGAVTSGVAPLVIHCVAAGAANPVAPYTNWGSAAGTIQAAITAAAAGEVVLVTNGVYATGGISMDGVITNCVSVNKAILVQSLNGPTTTFIQGAWDPTSTNGPGAVRCAWLTNSAILAGFTLQGGATRSGASQGVAADGGGIYGVSTNAWVYNCVIANNVAATFGGGVFKASLFHCTLTGNQAFAVGSSGGGACEANMENCLITGNVAVQANGGGTESCNATNCAYLLNSSTQSGGAADGGSLVNCTVTENTSSGYSAGYGGAVSSATLVNCIVYGNFSRTSYPNTNYNSCTLTYCDTDPLPAGTGNIDVNPQLLADGIHLAATSPVIGQGNQAVVSGTDIDGQPWNNPPSIGCDEWQPVPVATPPASRFTAPAYGVTLSETAAGQGPFSYTWSFNGAPLQDNGHYVNSGTANLAINQVSLADAGGYQVVVSNAVGVVTSSVVTLVVHLVNAAGNNPVPPYTSWATAATNIQDAVNAAATGDIVLVTNGLYAAGGSTLGSYLTNRVALTLPVSVIGINGSAVTTIQGAWDPTYTNGPNAVRCVYLADGAALTGFTLRNGATEGPSGNSPGNESYSGGGVWCNSTNGIVSDCVFSNNYALYGGGIWSGTVNNSFLTANEAFYYGGGAYGSTLNNCTMTYNFANSRLLNTGNGSTFGGGVYAGLAHNSIILYNADMIFSEVVFTDNYYPTNPAPAYFNTDTFPVPPGNGNTNVTPLLVDAYHLGLNSPCRGAGSAAYAGGVDIDGQTWANPPSMGCSEVVLANLGGPLTVSLTGWPTNVLANRSGLVAGNFSGRATYSAFAFGDGQAVTNSGLLVSHIWAQPGNYPVKFTVFNNDNPAGVSASVVVQILSLIGSPLQPIGVSTNGFQFQFEGVLGADYTIQYTTNLAPPAVWNALTTITYSGSGTIKITDPAAVTGTRFYRVLAQ